MDNEKVNHGLVVKIIDPNDVDEKINVLFIGMENEPNKEVIDYFYNELKSDPELGMFYYDDNENPVCMDFTVHVATKDEINEYLITQNEENV